MDTLSGSFSGHGSPDDGGQDYAYADDEANREAPPLAIGQDERRMQVRAYNFWASLLADRSFPSIEDLDPDNLPDFGPHSVLLDFTSGIEDPTVTFLGDKLAAECGTEGPIGKLSDVPSRSLLSRITDHYLQIIANQAPIGFEAEFVNQRGATIMYRGILLPFSSDDDTIDFIYGVINWKELADQQMTDELLAEVNHALSIGPETLRHEDALPEWADGPMDMDHSDDILDLGTEDFVAEQEDGDSILNLVTPLDNASFADDFQSADWPVPEFNTDTGFEAASEFEAASDFNELSAFDATPAFGAMPDLVAAPDFDAGDESVPDLLATGINADEAKSFGPSVEEIDSEVMGLADWLASARECAYAAQGSEERSRCSLYAAISRAYDFSLAAAQDSEGLTELLADAGLKAQERAPMTPIVKLVFGADYDKTRLAEFAAALSLARRLGLTSGALADHLAITPGGLKAIVRDERKQRSAKLGKPATVRQSPSASLARELRKLTPLVQVASEGSEFTLIVARRTPEGLVELIGEVGDEPALLERVARKLVG